LRVVVIGLLGSTVTAPAIRNLKIINEHRTAGRGR
jgi:hypothetical protein